MALVNGPTGPRVSPSLSSSVQETPRTSFLSRVQGGATAAVASPAAPAVSGKSIISSAIAAQKESSGKTEAPPADAQEQQRAAVKEMSKMFLQSTVQGIFQGFSAMPQVERE
jgi:hypothetical protein